MLINFRKAPTVIPDLFIDGVKVERVTEYRYLGTVLDTKLNVNKNTDYSQKMLVKNILPSEAILMSVMLFYALSTGVVLNQF